MRVYNDGGETARKIFPSKFVAGFSIGESLTEGVGGWSIGATAGLVMFPLWLIRHHLISAFVRLRPGKPSRQAVES